MHKHRFDGLLAEHLPLGAIGPPAGSGYQGNIWSEEISFIALFVVGLETIVFAGFLGANIFAGI